MKEKFSLKDALFNPVKVHQLASEIKAVYTEFEQNAFESDVLEAFETLELKARISHMAEMLYRHLPKRYSKAVELIEKALPPVLDTYKSDDDFGDFIYSPYASYVSMYGCNEIDLERSLALLRELTKRFSVEFAMRDFINAYPEETLAMLKSCAYSTNYHERRLASEGLRPKLPWAKKLTLTYTIPLPVLEILFADKTRYVTRSVANHLNDISKSDAPLVLETLKKWKASNRQTEKEMKYIISHALRTLVREGNTEALALLGYEKDPSIVLSELTLREENVQIGESLHFDFQIEAKDDCKLMLDYIIYFQTKRAKSSPKVYKIKKMDLKSGERVSIEKRHLFKAEMSTIKLYAGVHKVALQVNGTCYEMGSFDLKL